MVRKFKAGDRVKVIGGSDGPKMEVLKYIAKKEPLFGFVDRDTYVECMVSQWRAKIPDIPPKPSSQGTGSKRNVQGLSNSAIGTMLNQKKER
ncbi:hypothetical protein [Flagellimonas halotolerans]|uniref:Uncharacterized protein n=1 Tax=Flagellimonas halotolerans TaxID=3112164 RepID=A0ABU6IQS7_9FLAO|nr:MULTISPECIES: hypothetical protein [unclassified Allomuricauda]MEC3965515.1 hypothetical protein [Muricauda sp. SYSU M86414]MEC4265381.1 hypothetical protein [Muricauda sp. SYSU M84420]